MKNVIIDSCVFFKMIAYSDLYRETDRESVENTLNTEKFVLETIKSDLINIFPEEFIQKYPKATFDELLEKYKDYATNAIGLAERNIERNKLLVEGKVRINGEIVQMDITEEKKQQAQRNLEFALTQKEKISKTYGDYLKYREDYKDLKNITNAGELYLLAIDGKVKLHIASTSMREIDNHTDGHHNSTDPKYLSFAEEQVNGLASICTHIVVRQSQVVDMVDGLAEKFRTPIAGSKTKPMDLDKNSNNEFGDSQIMAESCLAGMVLITDNLKDFVVDKSKKLPNQDIRLHIGAVESRYSGVTSDALPISSEEFLTGDYKVPTRDSDAVEIVEMGKGQSIFADQIELIPANKKEKQKMPDYYDNKDDKKYAGVLENKNLNKIEEKEQSVQEVEMDM